MPGGFGFPLGFLLASIATIGAVAAGATADPRRALIALGLAILLIAGVSTPLATLGTAVVAWLLDAGFVLGRHGELAQTTPGARHAILLGAIALIAPLATHILRVIRSARHRPDVPAPREPLMVERPPLTNRRATT